MAGDFGFPAQSVPVLEKDGTMSIAWRGYFTKLNAFVQQCTTGPIVSTDGATAKFDGTSGKKLKQ